MSDNKQPYEKINLFKTNSSLNIYSISSHFYGQFKQLNLKTISDYFSFMEKVFKNINSGINKMDLRTFQEINRRQILLFFNSLDIEDFFSIKFSADFIGRLFSLLIESYETIFGYKPIDKMELSEDEDLFQFQKQLTYLMKNYQNILLIQLNNEKKGMEETLDNILSDVEFNENDILLEPVPTQQKFVTGIEQYENLFLLLDNMIFDIFSEFKSFSEIKKDIQYDYKRISIILDYQITNSGLLIQEQDESSSLNKLNKSLTKNKKIGDVKNVFSK